MHPTDVLRWTFADLRRRERGGHGELRGRRPGPPRPPRRPRAPTSSCSTRSTCSPRRCGSSRSCASGSTSTCASSARCPTSAPTTCWQTDVEALLRTCARSSRCSARWTARPRGSPACAASTVRPGPTLRSSRYDIGRNIAKINPLATWTDDDMALVRRAQRAARRTRSPSAATRRIGCWPCTRPVAPGEDKRGGRWAGNSKTECGLHA